MYDRTTTEIDTGIRAGDSDREATAERLRRHHAEGRINLDEFQERLDRCYEAKTSGELRALVADLPEEAQHTPRYFGRGRAIPLVAILVAILVVTAASNDGPHLFLFVFPLFLLARLFLFRHHRWNGRGPWSRAGGQA